MASAAIPAWKSLVLSAYCAATGPARQWSAWRRARAGESPVVALFYHRVADEHPNDWTMSRAMFARQIDWLSGECDIVSLAEGQRRLREGNRRTAVAITFDDGYAENCDFALPLLVERRLPFSYFVSVGNVLNQLPFPHDVAAGRPLPVNTIDQLRALPDNFCEIGNHTRTHPDLGQIGDPDRLFDETIAAGDSLAAAVSRQIRYFAFPFGRPQNLNAAAVRLLRDNGYLGYCSAYGGYNFPGDEPFHLQRIAVDDEFIRLKNWVTLDGRKQRQSEANRYVIPSGKSTDGFAGVETAGALA
jgi:peptidoglycan/xylan/chitin deacetylase (PgdA/CDA1 family)